MLHDGNPLKGRFIKHNDRLMKVIKLEDFDFHQLHADFTLYPDNQAGNVVHSRLHNPEVIEKNTALPPNLFPSLAEEHAAPNMQPRDFNEDWKEARQKALRKKGLTQEEEEDFDSELEQHFARLDQQRKHPHKREVSAIDTPEDGEPLSQEGAQTQQEDVASEPHHPLTINTEEQHRDPLSELKEPSQDFSIPSEENTEIEKTNEVDTHQEPAPQPAQMSGPTAEEIESLKQQASDEGHKEGHQTGYQTGYDEGVQKAQSDVKEQSEEILTQIQKMYDDIKKLKPQVMENIQSNFQEITAAICEGILGQTLSENPDLFANVVRKAVEEGVKDDTYHILVNETMYERLKNVGDENILSHLKVDSSLTGEDFKITTEWGEIEGGVSRKVRDLLQQADTRLFNLGDDDADPSV